MPDRPTEPESASPEADPRVQQLTRQLESAQCRASTLAERNRTSKEQLESAARNNRRMVELLEATREEITSLKKALDVQADPPFAHATVIAVHPARPVVPGREIAATVQDGADVLQNGRRLRVHVSALIELDALTPGAEVLLDESLTVVAVLGAERTGELVRVQEVLEDGLLVVVGRGEDTRVVRRSQPLAEATVRVGDAVTVDLRTHHALDLVPLTEVQDVILEEVPDVTYQDIGGLGPQIEQIRDAVEMPLLHPELYREHGLTPPQGILLYGPPGTGKTLIAKAVANSLAARAGEGQRSYFLNIKGPELLNKYVGETERHIRTIFARAREKAAQGHPVVVFFDEMESLFRTRGSGVSSDVETTIVPQLLAEIDGVETLDHVMVIGASNREDMIDPAILRPGRLDVKIRVERPDEAGAAEIFGKYVTPDLPLHPEELERAGGDRDAAVASMIRSVVDFLYARTSRTEFVDVSYADGTQRVLHYADFVSGAVISSIVDRAKTAAIKEHLAASAEGAGSSAGSDPGAGDAPAPKGLRTEHLLRAATEEFAEQEDLPASATPEDWARITGHRGPRVVGLSTRGSRGGRA